MPPRNIFLPLVALAMIALGGVLPRTACALEDPVATASGVALAPKTAESFAQLGGDALDDPTTGRVPNYLRALAVNHPKTVRPFAHLFQTVVFGGTVTPETKAAMGLHIARENGSAYLTAHLTRLLRTTDSGRALLAPSQGAAKEDERTQIALRYTDHLTRAIHGVSDTDFAQAHAVYNDAQMVELTATTCFFNYFARFCQGANLPLEAWATEAPNALPKRLRESDDRARISLASDAEMQMAARILTPSPELKKGLGIGVANSQRAMLRVPDIADAWWGYWQAVREDSMMPRELLLQISFAVSMANGCRYCTLHQVAGLRRLGVEPAKLIAMKKDDAALTPKEQACVTFARKLTKTPATTNAADFAALRTAVGSDREAVEALLQTCAFNFMNRFTDGLHLPSEDEAIKVYQEVYGPDAYKTFLTTP